MISERRSMIVFCSPIGSLSVKTIERAPQALAVMLTSAQKPIIQSGFLWNLDLHA
jgi:hypothetical protein